MIRKAATAVLPLLVLGLAAPAQADAAKRCPKGKVEWKLEGRRSCAPAPKVQVAAKEDTLPALALPMWVRNGARPVAGHRSLAPRRLLRAVPKVARQAGRIATRAAARARPRAAASQRAPELDVKQFAERQELGRGVFSEATARIRLLEDDSWDLSMQLEIRDRTTGRGVLMRPITDYIGQRQDPVACPTSDGIVEATHRFGTGGTKIAVRGNTVLGAATERSEWVARARGRVGTDARLERITTEVTLVGKNFSRGLQMVTAIRGEVRWQRGGESAVAGTPSVDVSIRAAGAPRAMEQAEERRQAAATAAAPKMDQALGVLAGLAQERLLEAEPSWYEPNNDCAEVRYTPPSGAALAPGAQMPVTAEVFARADGRAAEGVFTVTDVHRGTFEATSPTSAPGAPARFAATADKPNEWGQTVSASVVATSRAGRVVGGWSASAGGHTGDGGKDAVLPQRYTGTLSANWSATGRAVDWTGTATFTRESVTKLPDGTFYAIYELTDGALTSASDAINPGCGWLATGTGGQIDAGDVELHVRPDGSAQYALLYDMRIANVVFQPSGCPLEPFTGDISARLNSRRPGPPDGHLRAADPDLGLRATGVTDLTAPVEGAAMTGSWTLEPQGGTR